MARVSVDPDVCGSIGACEAMAPAVFEVPDDGAVLILLEDIPAAEYDNVRRAVADCPTRALTLSD
jgi:ferredoxin